ncbi:aspartic peptidase domain-containing protein [Stachybotrys elegans]|uniref:Aspartic peptidase domain-containing protein n=1 Tax=Stachybotrys elegans TaxID=80388 RepID=A0A8K0WTQ1_9HYPO|nr:aspartic peptidase domain-containing protein [Stachybotrys elegans]
MRLVASAFCSFQLAPWAFAQVVQWDIKHQFSTSGLRRRSDLSFEAVLENRRARGGYYATVEVGNPHQEITLQIDTGSSDTWIPFQDADICTNDSSRSRGCCLGSFNPTESSSFSLVGQNMFDITYADDSYSRGDYFEDDFRISGMEITNMTMGLGLRSSIPHGLLGIGYASNEASIHTANVMYPNLPIAMEQAGLVNTVAYSLWLNDLGASYGNILFGGVDTAKYIGNLTIIDLLPDQRTQNFTQFAIPITSLEASSPTGNDILSSQEMPVEAVLDSGTTLTYMPNDLAQLIWDEVGAVYDSSYDLAVLPCSYGTHKGHFSFGFAGPSGPHINIAMDELVIDLTDGSPPRFSNGPYRGKRTCVCGFQNLTSGPYVLGDSFLRSAYVVFDLINHQVAIAPTDFNATRTEIITFESRGATIPSATVAPSQGERVHIPQTPRSSLSAAEGFQSNASRSYGLSSVTLAVLSLAVGLAWTAT